jgi:hypothetical protein
MANFAECIIEKMPGVANPAARSAIMRSCYQKYPAGLLEIERGSGRGMFGFKDQDACIIKKAKDTPFQPAASAIAYACACLYKKPQFEGEMCDYPKVP